MKICIKKSKGRSHAAMSIIIPSGDKSAAYRESLKVIHRMSIMNSKGNSVG